MNNHEDIHNFFTIYFILDNDQEEIRNSVDYTNDGMLESLLSAFASRLGRLNRNGEQYDEHVHRIYRNLSRILTNRSESSSNTSQVPITTNRENSQFFVIFDFFVNGSNVSMEVERPHASLNDTILLFETILSMRENKKKIKKEQLNKFKRFRVTKKMLKDDCTICMNKFKNRELARILPCEHTFHSKCVDKWLTSHSNTCPVCRKELV